jgi:hypothetical protein
LTIPAGSKWASRDGWRLPKSVKRLSVFIDLYATQCAEGLLKMLDRSVDGLESCELPSWDPDRAKLEEVPRLCQKITAIGMDYKLLPMASELPLTSVESLEVRYLGRDAEPWTQFLARFPVKRLKLTYCRTSAVVLGLPPGLEALELYCPRPSIPPEQFETARSAILASGAKKITIEADKAGFDGAEVEDEETWEREKKRWMGLSAVGVEVVWRQALKVGRVR